MEFVSGTRKAPQSKPFEAMMSLRCAKRISTFFRSLRDLKKALVFIFRRVMSRASSWTLHTSLRADSCGQHLGLSAQDRQSRLEAKYRMAKSLWIRPVVRSRLPAGQI
jgi:hypothetical protein